MDFEKKVYSKELLSILYESGKTIGTAESCTAGKIAAAITMIPGASDYFKGGLICYWDDMKISLLNVDTELINEKSAVCEEVAIQMVKGTIEKLGVDYAVATTGFAGPGTIDGIPVGTIWIACGNKEQQVTHKMEEDNGRDKNVNDATDKALEMLLNFITEQEPARITDEIVELTAE